MFHFFAHRAMKTCSGPRGLGPYLFVFPTAGNRLTKYTPAEILYSNASLTWLARPSYRTRDDDARLRMRVLLVKALPESLFFHRKFVSPNGELT